MKQFNVNNGICTVYKDCTVTNKRYEVVVEADKYFDYISGRKLIQNIFPGLTVDQREFLISGFTPHEWSKMFDDLQD